MFNQKEKSVLLSLDTILGSLNLDSTNEDPSETLWYLDIDESVIMVVHPAYGVTFFNDEMHILGLYDRRERGAILDLLDGWSYDHDSMVWREIGIDQIDYSPV
ncbi:hypothetical protein KNV05_gp103 [Vibrio phage River4]|uniref:Uncharacterized protein n=1 Tax=Vibrio phage River4 TaxID=2736288 RepID=A0A6M9Z084_9CAUD|nr:hypothetical protein KNV05_gp009 [Vibrio phage River4]YP_010108038.1 hypothetical protein KNV05_gp103 [Vibrio phage River4]QKN84671.1 hypothetical protein RIVER4_9 [Vibrio phage River4]QKN84852.1 hypothetical protein RIVER4_213 [Vibrio phage River4]